MKSAIGIIGFGNMGSAIGERLKSSYKIRAFDKDRFRTNNLEGIDAAEDIIDLLNKVNTVILAVKPQDFAGALKEIKNYTKDKLVISIAAGIATEYIEKYLGQVRVVRVMPNILAKAGEGLSCLCPGKFATPHDLDFTQGLFAHLGKTLKIKEEMMNAATAVSGSGPAYVCEYIEKKRKDFLKDFQKAAKAIGFSPDEAAFLVKTTFSGTLNFLKKTKVSPGELKKQVASKGGTTEAALAVLERGGSLDGAVKAALLRAEELTKKE